MVSFVEELGTQRGWAMLAIARGFVEWRVSKEIKGAIRDVQTC